MTDEALGPAERTISTRVVSGGERQRRRTNRSPAVTLTLMAEGGVESYFSAKTLDSLSLPALSWQEPLTDAAGLSGPE